MFEEEYLKFWQEFGRSKKMVLSTSLNDIVTSRTMSIINLNNILYFQTDHTFRKYDQLKNNTHVALCIDNIQIEGSCNEIGKPIENEDFCNAYRECFTSSFNRYTMLNNERLFAVIPTFIERWVYINNFPYMQIFDIKNRKYILKQYFGI
ncbi:MAG: pyridoxamine 5'-phosphate oxidase family protein [Lachnospiraceae bacterium]|nr:pyridoxamine 5'-phosphate oxidase family protein [Lachnospiraceae bacterium]